MVAAYAAAALYLLWLFYLAVCWWTKGDFSHCEMVVDGSLEKAVCWSSSYRDCGVRRKVIDLTSGHWVITRPVRIRAAIPHAVGLVLVLLRSLRRGDGAETQLVV